MKFGERLKKARLEKGLSQTELGKLADVHYTQIGRYEKKGSQPAADVLAKLANALGVSSDYLMYGTTEEIANNNLSDKELINMFQIVDKMDNQDKNVIKIFLDAFITKRKIQQLA